jgi:iron-sulfur cluster assembly accessory protein
MTLTEAAAVKALALLANEGDDSLALRIAVAPGGCAGMRYELSLDENSFDGDVSEEFYGVKLVTDQMSAPYLSGATIDYVDTIQQQGFTIDNPNAENSCACGNSFH